MKTKPQRETVAGHYSRIEHEAWLNLVRWLKETGAVTESDCTSPMSDRQSKGQRLFEAIRSWGSALVELERSETESAEIKVHHFKEGV